MTILLLLFSINLFVEEERNSMIKVKESQLHCTYCNGNGYIQLQLGGSETCIECYGVNKWVNEPLNKDRKDRIELVHLKLT